MEKNTKIIKKLEEYPAFKKAKTILLYASIGDQKEVDTLELIEKYMEKKSIILPKIDLKNKKMALFKIKNLIDLKENKLKIMEPTDTCELIEPSEIDLAIIPGIAFDTSGNRIGFGFGFYDRLLKKLHCPKLALAYEFQILHAIPRHPHDMSVDIIISEKKIYIANQKTFIH